MRRTFLGVLAATLLGIAGIGCGDRTGSSIPTTNEEPKTMPVSTVGGTKVEKTAPVTFTDSK